MISATSNTSTLTIQQLALQVNLGWPESERAETQTVWVDITIVYPQEIKACTTDNLADTICYAELINQLHQWVTTKEFRLLEHFTHELYFFLKQLIPGKIKLSIKKLPELPGLQGGVCFSYGDNV